jgi:class 3 adenylate cyclase
MPYMPYAHISRADLNLLHTLFALLEEKHVTRAARRCFLSQPAMSRALERLREMFGDELLIRVGVNTSAPHAVNASSGIRRASCRGSSCC